MGACMQKEVAAGPVGRVEKWKEMGKKLQICPKTLPALLDLPCREECWCGTGHTSRCCRGLSAAKAHRNPGARAGTHVRPDRGIFVLLQGPWSLTGEGGAGPLRYPASLESWQNVGLELPGRARCLWCCFRLTQEMACAALCLLLDVQRAPSQ